MMSVPIPANETDRIVALRRYDILDTPPEEPYDRITRIAAAQFGVPVALISLIDEDRQWFKSRQGLAAEETARDIAFCAYSILGKGVMVVPDATKDARFAGNPLVTGLPGIRFYAAAPLCTADGFNLGTLCVIDYKPGNLTEEQKQTLQDLAGAVVDQLEFRRVSKRALAYEQAERRSLELSVRAKTEELSESEERFRDMAANVPGVVYQFRIDAFGKVSFPYVSPSIKGLLGLDAAAVMEDPEAISELVHSDDRASLDAAIEESHRSLKPAIWEGRIVRMGGDVGWFRGSSIPRRLADGSVLWNGLLLDITERKEAEQEVRTRDAWLRAILDNAPIEIVLKDTEGRIMASSQNVAKILGVEPEVLIGSRTVDVMPPHIASIYMDADRRVLETGQPLQQEVVEEVDGAVRYSLNAKFPLRDTAGRTAGVCSITSDITEAKQAEARLRQAYKMEAVGQLTGGVAHDFNNLLTVIMGNTEVLAATVGGSGDLTEAILRASARGAELTQRLLAFSRQQTLWPQPLDLGALVEGMSGLLRRSLGETIEIGTTAQTDLWLAWADSGQVENALLNLAINARDAMEGGGKLTIECGNARLDEDFARQNSEAVPGDYVVLSVSDTGSGMSPDVKERAFEPFFTTKEVGKGSGLGLSMVYGFAKQSEGQVFIDSKAGHGTTVKLYLARAKDVKTSRDAGAVAVQERRGRGQVVMVIEDDPDVRALAKKMIEGLGYCALDVPDAASARALLAEGRKIDLVLSDVVLPGGLSGTDFARETTGRYPDLRTIFMSGYPADAMGQNGTFDGGQVLLHKPFERSQLANALHAALEG